nr:MAG TPA: hypothetical protein [Caudoviricetes sp.]
MPNKSLPAFSYLIALFLMLSIFNSSFIKNCVSKVNTLFLFFADTVLFMALNVNIL